MLIYEVPSVDETTGRVMRQLYATDESIPDATPKKLYFVKNYSYDETTGKVSGSGEDAPANCEFIVDADGTEHNITFLDDGNGGIKTQDGDTVSLCAFDADTGKYVCVAPKEYQGAEVETSSADTSADEDSDTTPATTPTTSDEEEPTTTPSTSDEDSDDEETADDSESTSDGEEESGE